MVEENKVENKEVEEKVETPAQPSTENPQQRPQRNGQRGKKGDRRPNRSGAKKVVVKEYEEKVVKINRVTKVVKGGKRMKFSAVVVIGNKKGKFGFGTGKSGEVPDAIKKAVEAAKKNLSSIQVTKSGSIAHESIGKFGATTVFLKPAPEGTGIVAGGPVRNICELAGIENIYSKVYGSRTSINVIRATFKALGQVKNSKEIEALRKGGEEDVK